MSAPAPEGRHPQILTQSVGWNARGHDGFYPTRFPVNERAGGERGFRALLVGRTGTGLPHVRPRQLFQRTCRTVPTGISDCVIHDLYGQPLVHGWWAGGVEYASWQEALPPARLEKHLARVRDLGVHGKMSIMPTK